MERVHWTEIHHTHHNKKPSEAMLLDGGMDYIVKCRLRGESPRINPCEERVVTFDSDYISFRVESVLKALAIYDRHKILRDLFFKYEDEIKELDASDEVVSIGKINESQ